MQHTENNFMDLFLKKLLENKLYLFIAGIISCYFIYQFGKRMGEFIYIVFNK